jgi:hypothetical protein
LLLFGLDRSSQIGRVARRKYCKQVIGFCFGVLKPTLNRPKATSATQNLTLYSFSTASTTTAPSQQTDRSLALYM